MTEKYIEQKLVRAVKERGGIAPKFVSPGLDGVPDRIVLLPMGRIAFVELKAPGNKMRPLQVRRKGQLEALGFLVYCIDGLEQIEEVLKEMGGDAK
ncbi:TPA: VRR-NUC domain-containing protein [Listeria monocytogenes]|nr:VRR-NUC domain-containing protein [Listeria monocytogenes]HDI3440529.1 VRR-NUC domain-containing protein [Listeria monocytogenes]